MDVSLIRMLLPLPQHSTVGLWVTGGYLLLVLPILLLYRSLDREEEPVYDRPEPADKERSAV
jgi:hypothetical protein